MLTPSLLLFSILGITVGRQLPYRSGTCEAIKSEPWSYDEDAGNGPSEWGTRYPNCYGSSQSPIRLVKNEAQANSSLQALALSGYDKAVSKATILNNGHTAQITPGDGVTRTLTIDGKTYTLRQLHFHWGTTYYEGSEHSLNEVEYAMEGHFVHMSDDNKIAVLGLLYEAGPVDNPSLSPIIQELPRIPFKNDQVDMRSSINLAKMLPSNLSSYFRYQGSLTTPPCDEGVTWTVLQKRMKISNKQLHYYRSLYEVTKDQASHQCHLVNNFRPLQPLNNRVVYTTA